MSRKRPPPLQRPEGSARRNPLMREPAQYRGAASCESCHAAEYRSQQQSRHARTLLRTADLVRLHWPEDIVPDTNNSRVTHRFRRIEDRIEVETRVDNQAFTALVQYAMGSNHHGQSFLAPKGRDRSANFACRTIPAHPSGVGPWNTPSPRRTLRVIWAAPSRPKRSASA